MNDKVSVEELAMLLGARLIEIHVLQKALAAAQKRIAELEKPQEETVVP